QGSPTSNTNQDPFFTSTGRATGQKSALVTLMSSYKNETTDNRDYDNSGGIGGTVNIWTYTNYKGLYNGVLPDTAKRWNTFVGLYLGEKLKNKIAITGTCAYQNSDSSYTIVHSPSLPSDTATINLTNFNNILTSCNNTCDENVIIWMNMMKAKCSITWTGSDSIKVCDSLKAYCKSRCGFADPYAFLIKEDLTTNHYLSNAQTLLNSYSCKLDSIAIPNPCGRTVNKNVTMSMLDSRVPFYFDLINEVLDTLIKHCPTQNSNCITPSASLVLVSHCNTYLNNRSIFDYPSWEPLGVLQKIYVGANATTGSGLLVELVYSTFGGVNHFLWFYDFTDHEGITNSQKIKRIKNVRVDPLHRTSMQADVEFFDGTVIIYPQNHNLTPSNLNTTAWDTLIGFPAVNMRTATYSVCDSISSSFSNTYFSLPFNPRSVKDSCIAAQKKEAISLGTKAWKDTVNSYVSSFLSTHFNKCVNTPFAENFYYSSNEPKQCHYTLYYYDQGGNLVQTVPPAGVNILDVSSPAFDATGKFTGTNQPVHRLLTKYKYNSLNQLIWQTTPDAGVTNFYFNDFGQTRISQNSYQKSISSGSVNKYSYSRYDNLGRVIEVGQLENFPYDSSAIYGASLATVKALLNDATFPQSGSYTLTQITQTFYDSPYSGSSIAQSNLRGRVSATVYMP
ncbi:MAG TPA: hypothetical protein VNW99_04845, partial [Cytophagaceae bacterium]|nr:hypothetical protein [Cytophagaceae bacterium]